MLQVIDLGLAPYAVALAFQRGRRDQRLAGAAPDTLLLLEHPPVFTRGRGSSPAELMVQPEVLRAQGFDVFDIERGGKTTYHGPGQLVGYPIVSLRDLGVGVPEYVGLLEQCVIDYLAVLGLPSARRKGYPGVWVDDRKIAAIGVHLKQWVSMHGFAVNLAPNLAHFDLILPCGLPDVRVTSVQAELGCSPSIPDAKRSIAACFQAAFGYADVAWEQVRQPADPSRAARRPPG